jgi:hypothetical protein
MVRRTSISLAPVVQPPTPQAGLNSLNRVNSTRKNGLACSPCSRAYRYKPPSTILISASVFPSYRILLSFLSVIVKNTVCQVRSMLQLGNLTNAIV